MTFTPTPSVFQRSALRAEAEVRLLRAALSEAASGAWAASANSALTAAAVAAGTAPVGPLAGGVGWGPAVAGVCATFPLTLRERSALATFATMLSARARDVMEGSDARGFSGEGGGTGRSSGDGESARTGDSRQSGSLPSSASASSSRESTAPADSSRVAPLPLTGARFDDGESSASPTVSASLASNERGEGATETAAAPLPSTTATDSTTSVLPLLAQPASASSFSTAGGSSSAALIAHFRAAREAGASRVTPRFLREAGLRPYAIAGAAQTAASTTPRHPALLAMHYGGRAGISDPPRK